MNLTILILSIYILIEAIINLILLKIINKTIANILEEKKKENKFNVYDIFLIFSASFFLVLWFLNNK